MANLAEKQLLPKIFVGGIGLILLGIGIGGLASLPSTFFVRSFPHAGAMMEYSMMDWKMMDGMMDPMMESFAPGRAPTVAFVPNVTAAFSAYWFALLGLYIGLIVAGAYLIYRAVSPMMKSSTQTTIA